MQVCIHRGSNEIGGTCIEIESQGKRLVLDVGLPLDAPDPDEFPLHPVPGFQAPDPSLSGVVVSHPHLDHYGLARRLPDETPFLIGEAAQAILSAAALFSPAGLQLSKSIHLRDREPIWLGPFTITPFLVDHSAYDSYAVLVEADGKKLFYTGDFRAHGRKAKLFERLIETAPSNVDVLLMEGTTLGRPGCEGRFPTEDDLVSRFVELFQQTKGMPLVWVSGQNIDRLVTIFKACRKARRQFIIDMYTAEILRATGNERLPQAEWAGLRVFLPKTQRSQIKRAEAFEVSEHYHSRRIYLEGLAEAAPRSVMLFRPSMRRDLDEAQCLHGASIVCSVWGGYLRDGRNGEFVEWVERNGLPIHDCHTSGHASPNDLKRLRDAFPSAVAVPVHLENRGRFVDLFGNVAVHEDGEWWQV